MYLRNQQLAVAVGSDTPSRFKIVEEPQRDVAFNTYHSNAQLFVGVFYVLLPPPDARAVHAFLLVVYLQLLYPVELICVMVSKMLVIDRISKFLKKVCKDAVVVLQSVFVL
jgi:hypothetical protein